MPELMYNQSLKDYRDYHNTMDSAVKVAVTAALNEQTKETIIRLLKIGKLSSEEIAEANDVPLELVLQIQEEMKQ